MTTCNPIATRALASLPRIEDLTRRQLISSALAAALLIACGDDENASEGATRTVDDYFGPVTLPERPERVIAAEGSTLPVVVSLGVKPIAMGVNFNSLPRHLADQIEDVEDITAEGGEAINLERAAALDPDLIITFVGNPGDPWNKEVYESYKPVAPTFGYAFGYTYIEDVYANLDEIAKALGREDRAQELKQDYEDRVAELRQRVIDAELDDKPVAVIRIMADANYWLEWGLTSGIAFRAIGIPHPEGQEDPEEFGMGLSLEQLEVLNQAHAVFMYVDDNAVADGATVTGSDVWKSLEPVKNDRVYTVNSGVWNSGDLTGLMLILDDIESMYVAPAEA